MSSWEPVPATAFRRQPWANGRGVTTELAAGPNRDRWQWRISMAQVDRDGPYSVLPGVRRQLAPLDAPIELSWPDGRRQRAERLQTIQFDGADAVIGHVPEGPTRDLNLMLCAGFDGELVARPLVGRLLLPPRPGRWLLLQLAGTARVTLAADSQALAAGAAAWVSTEGGGPVHVEGRGELALIRIAASV